MGRRHNLLKNLHKLENYHIMAGLWGFDDGINNKLNADIQRLVSHPINAQTIYILEVYPPSIMPRFYHASWLIKAILNGLVSHYNHGMASEVHKLQKKYPHRTIRIVPVSKWLKTLDTANTKQALALYPLRKRGKDCATAAYKQGQNYMREPTPLDNCRGYMFWNGIHPTMQTHQIIAYKLEKMIEKTERK